MVKLYRKSGSLSALWVTSNEKLSDFYLSSWQSGESPIPMLVVRVILALWALAILTWSLIDGGSAYWIIYLTHWGLLLVAITTLSGLCVSISFISKRTCETTTLPWFVSLHWLLFNLTVTMSVMITALYWILLYDPDVHEEAEDPVRAFWLDVTIHGFTACIMMAEVIISRIPVRLAHVYQPLGIGLWYAAFSVIYYAAGGTDALGNKFIYELLNWQYCKRATVVVIGSVIGLIILYLLIWGIAFCRDKITVTYVRTSNDVMLASRINQLDPKFVV